MLGALYVDDDDGRAGFQVMRNLLHQPPAAEVGERRKILRQQRQATRQQIYGPRPAVAQLIGDAAGAGRVGEDADDDARAMGVLAAAAATACRTVAVVVGHRDYLCNNLAKVGRDLSCPAAARFDRIVRVCDSV